MTKYIGRRINIGLAPETTRGVGVEPTVVVPKTDYNLEDKANKATSEESFSNIAGFGAYEIVTQKHGAGDISGEVNLSSLPLWLWGTFGTLSTTASGSDYKHTVSIADSNQHKSLTVSTHEDNGDRMFRRCMIDTFEMSIDTEAIVTYTASILSRVSKENDWTPSYETVDYKFVGRDLEFKVAADTTGLAAATGLNLKELNFTVQKNGEQDLETGTIEPTETHNKQCTIEGSLTLTYEDRTWANYMLDGDYKAISIKLTNTRQTLSGAGTPTFYLELPRVAFAEWERDNSNDDIVSQSLNFKVLYDIANGQYISDCYVINDKASY